MQPHRSQQRPLHRVRRRHRTWVRAMILATAGWAVVWAGLMAHKWSLWTVDSGPLGWIGAALAVPGTLYALATLRAEYPWILVALVALFANGSLLALPWLLSDELALLLGE